MDCEELIKVIIEAIKDEQKAQPEYKNLAFEASSFLKVRGANGTTSGVVREGIMGLAKDEGKHEKFLTELLASVRDVCPTERYPVSEEEAAIGLGRLFEEPKTKLEISEAEARAGLEKLFG
jgi:hypothetical protein